MPAWIIRDAKTASQTVLMVHWGQLKYLHLGNQLWSPPCSKSYLTPWDTKKLSPCSKVSFVSTVLMGVVAQLLTSYMYMTDNNQHAYLQSGYKRGHSTDTALVKVQNDIITSIDQHGIVILILLDLSAALYTIDHDVLFSRMDITLSIWTLECLR